MARRPHLTGDHYKHWRLYHAENPHVAVELAAVCRNIKAMGERKFSMTGAFNLVRYLRFIETRDANSIYKISASYSAYYARLLMRDNPDLDGFFYTRECPAEYQMEAFFEERELRRQKRGNVVDIFNLKDKESS
jgi:hypothetical protein